ncbi:hypothetical protein [Aureibacillus halotolerans]|uniref:LysM domain-containing protein n=1 Tax=Aureibacillus halotolerans TaxID=1508390 RepID=A0A4R6U5F8_9BACI|nr:hypothetical protein [Aureibacillus halotolerans]TDQ41710.1 hypothetical protein EV213_103296 [Aureibacillus halotolerans]
MKQFIVVVLSFAIIYAIVYDFRSGTIPSTQSVGNWETVDVLQQDELLPSTRSEENNTYIEHMVKPGDTVLGIIESLHDNQIPVPIEQISEDFIALNQSPVNTIEAGEVYRFPLYNQ